MKRSYSSPSLRDYGDMKRVTEQAGNDIIDALAGTADPNTGACSRLVGSRRIGCIT